MATKMKLLKMLQEVKGHGSDHEPPARAATPLLYLMQLRSQGAQTNTPPPRGGKPPPFLLR